jgi:2-oxoisovalerate dehydrogenase E2 component (dihydrolipoyl transacylase)
MAEHVIRLPDVGEGIAEAELVEWHVKVGDLVRADTTLAAVMTDKATVEIPSPADGEITWLGAAIGDKVAVGSDLVRLKIPGERDAASEAQPQPRSAAAEAAEPVQGPAWPTARIAARRPCPHWGKLRPGSRPARAAHSSSRHGGHFRGDTFGCGCHPDRSPAQISREISPV